MIVIWYDQHVTGGDVDYTSGPYSVILPAGEISVPFNISVNDDNIFEDSEIFMLTISSSLPNDVASGNPNKARVIIMDNDCKLW